MRRGPLVFGFDQVHAMAPYSRKTVRDTRNSTDGIYAGGGTQLTLPIVQHGQGYTSTFGIGLQMP